MNFFLIVLIHWLDSEFDVRRACNERLLPPYLPVPSLPFGSSRGTLLARLVLSRAPLLPGVPLSSEVALSGACGFGLGRLSGVMLRYVYI